MLSGDASEKRHRAIFLSLTKVRTAVYRSLISVQAILVRWQFGGTMHKVIWRISLVRIKNSQTLTGSAIGMAKRTYYSPPVSFLVTLLYYNRTAFTVLALHGFSVCIPCIYINTILIYYYIYFFLFFMVAKEMSGHKTMSRTVLCVCALL